MPQELNESRRVASVSWRAACLIPVLLNSSRVLPQFCVKDSNGQYFTTTCLGKVGGSQSHAYRIGKARAVGEGEYPFALYEGRGFHFGDGVLRVDANCGAIKPDDFLIHRSILL